MTRRETIYYRQSLNTELCHATSPYVLFNPRSSQHSHGRPLQIMVHNAAPRAPAAGWGGLCLNAELAGQTIVCSLDWWRLSPAAGQCVV